MDSNVILKKGDFHRFPPEALPMLVLSDGLDGFFGFVTRRHTRGNYAHVMTMATPGRVVSMDFQGLRNKSITPYLQGRHRIKVWRPEHWTAAQREAFLGVLGDQIARHPAYDWLGIAGQALRWPWMNNPRKMFCSEQVAACLRAAGEDLPKRPSPADINRHCMHSPGWRVVGRFIPD